MKFCYNTSFSLPNNPKDLDLSYELNLDLGDLFWNGKKKHFITEEIQ